MIVVVPDPELAKLLATRVLLIATWPATYPDVMILLTTLKVAGPTLLDVLAVGLVTLITPPRGKPSAEVVLATGDVRLQGVACRESGAKVREPHIQQGDVKRLEVVDLAAAGRSWLGQVG